MLTAPWVVGSGSSLSTDIQGTADASADSWEQHFVDLRAGQTVTATLSWTTNANLNLFLYAPDGTLLERSNDFDNPESLEREIDQDGTYKLGIKAKTGSSTNYDLRVDVVDREMVLQANAPGGAWRTHPFEVGEDETSISARLDWARTSENLNLFLINPAGKTVVASNKLDRPEVFTFDQLYAGTWVLAIKHKTSNATDYTIRYQTNGGGTPPEPPEPPAPPPVVDGPLVPPYGVLLGLSGDFQEPAGKYGSFTNREIQLDRQMDIYHGYHKFGDAFPKSQEIALSDEGRLLFLNWKPDISKGQTWSRIASGEFDGVIRAAADRIRNFGKDMFLAFHHEFDTPHNTDQFGTPAEYAQAYRQVHRVFSQANTDNVVWVWNPTGWKPDRAAPFYPGDAYVDWLGFDLYNWSYCRGDGDKWKSFADAVRPAYLWARDNYPTKPIMLPEWGSQENSRAGESRADWFDAIIPSLKAEFPAIKALTYFDVDVNFQEAACQWQVDHTTESLEAFKRFSHDDYTNVLHTVQ